MTNLEFHEWLVDGSEFATEQGDEIENALAEVGAHDPEAERLSRALLAACRALSAHCTAALNATGKR